MKSEEYEERLKNIGYFSPNYEREVLCLIARVVIEILRYLERRLV